jgi:outer membrane receptor protein involved in Fe transport
MTQNNNSQNGSLLMSRSVAAFFAALALCMGTVAHATDDSSKHFEIKAKPLADALMEFGVQSGLTVVAPTTLTAGKKAAAVRGDLAPTDALGRLLKGSGLTFARAADGTIAIEAAESNGPVQASARELEMELSEIVVTGTRISGVGASPTLPLISITHEQILSGGYTSVSDALRTLPMNFSNYNASSFADLNNPSPGFDTGLTAVNLRGLGSGATLVLIDGQRSANAPTQDGTIVDISKIPVGMIERIDVITGAASSIYGGDAVAGVINIITRKDYQGSETFVSANNSSSKSDGYEIRQLFGTGWGSGNLTANFNYQEQKPAQSAALGITSEDQVGRGGSDYRDYTFTQPPQLTTNFGTVTIPGAPADAAVALLPAGNGRNVTTNNLTYISGADLANHTGNYNLITPSNDTLQRYLTPDSQSYGARIALTQNLFDGMDMFLNASYSKHKTLTQNYNLSGTEIVPASNAFNNFGQAVAVNYSFVNEIQSGLMPVPTDTSNDDSVAFAGGFTLALPWKDWQSRLDFNAERDRNRSTLQTMANVNYGNGLYSNPNPTVYNAYVAALNSSNPNTAINYFGNGTGQGADIHLGNFLLNSDNGSLVSNLRSINLNFNGTVLSLPMGSMKAAVGVEIRRESLDFSEYVLDPFIEQPSRNLQAAYGELYVPLVHGEHRSEKSAVLLLELATRYDRYTISGPFIVDPVTGNTSNATRTFSASSPQVGLRWQPGAGFTVKANWSRAFQAPTIQDLFNPPFSFVETTYDPLNPGGAAVVPYLYESGGNPNLQPQTSTSATFELSYAPPSLPGLTAIVDFNHIEIKNVVSVGVDPTATTTIQILTDPALNPGVVRNAAGVLQSINYAPINAALQHSQSLDFRVFYNFSTAWGTFAPGVTGTYTMELNEQITAAAPPQITSGTVLGPSTWRVIPSVLWEKGNWGANLFVLYSSAVKNTDSESPQREIGSLTTVDSQVNWKLPNEGLRFALGAHNLLNVAPPFYDSPFGIDFSRYNPVGRQFYLNAIKSFGGGSK